MADPERTIRDDSDELLESLRELRRLEEQKREQEMSSPGFHELAERVDDQARVVFDRAHKQLEDGEDVPREETTIDDVDPAGL